MKLLGFGLVFLALSVAFFIVLPGSFKVLLFAPFSVSVLSLFLWVYFENQKKSDITDEYKRKDAIMRTVREVGLKGNPRDIGELMDIASAQGKEKAAYDAFQRAMSK